MWDHSSSFAKMRGESKTPHAGGHCLWSSVLYRGKHAHVPPWDGVHGPEPFADPLLELCELRPLGTNDAINFSLYSRSPSLALRLVLLHIPHVMSPGLGILLVKIGKRFSTIKFYGACS